MRTILVIIASVLLCSSAYAGWVNGYTRSDGTQVRGHYRSNPDGIKSNNYGSPKNEYERNNPTQRDNDGDGISNVYDTDDDNDGIHDNYDKNQYGGSQNNGSYYGN